MVAQPRPSLRETQLHHVRERIFQAVVEIVLEEGVPAFTMQRVAERAGISQRTVYRHFASRQALLDAFAEMGDQVQREQGLELPESLDALPGHIAAIFASWDAHERVVRAIVLVRLATGMQDASRRQRTQALRRAFETQAPALQPCEIDEAFDALRALVSTTTWYQMRVDAGMSGAQAGRSVAYAVRVIIDDLKRRSDERRSK